MNFSAKKALFFESGLPAALICFIKAATESDLSHISTDESQIDLRINHSKAMCKLYHFSCKCLPIRAVILAMLTFTFLACKSPTEEAPDDVLTTLMEGNQRFSGQSDENDQNTKKLIQELSENGQQPDAIIISCSDSRVAPELIFDQTLGKLFVIRTAGNIIGDYELGSIEYAVQSFNTPLIVVMGHSKCGAIDAFLQHRQDHVEGHIQDIIDYIKNEPEELAIEKEGVLDMDHAIHANVLHGINVLKHDQPIISERYEKGELRIVGAIYHIEDGRVEIIR